MVGQVPPAYVRLAAEICRDAGPWSGMIYDDVKPGLRLVVGCYRGKWIEVRLLRVPIAEQTLPPTPRPCGPEDPRR